VPLNRPALTLGSGPSGVQQARQWVIDACHAIDRPELVECAEFGVSELVTNAVLHGEPPIKVRFRGTLDHPRVEVSDGSTEPPILPGSESLGDDSDLLLTFGRGLGIVARCSTAWGVEIENDGKVVWFVPAREPREGDGVKGLITGLAESENGTMPLHALTQVEVRSVPLAHLQAFQVHYRELRREVRLLALAHESDYPLAKTLSDLFGSLDHDLRHGISNEDLESAQAEGKSAADLRVSMPRKTAESIGRFLELLDLADAFCREERLLSLARTPEQRRFQQWFLGEFVRQVQGEEPLAWPDTPEPGQSGFG
jgi:anti-sigma regulatory factor (Ser/Thr protein kinase)